MAVRSEPGSSRKSSGSETACAPAGTATDEPPPKVTLRVVPSRMAPVPARPSSGSATDTLVIGSTAPPNALENRSRIWSPPAETWTVCRSVVSVRTASSWVNGAGGMLDGSVSCGIDVHAATQCAFRSCGPGARSAPARSPAPSAGEMAVREAKSAPAVIRLISDDLRFMDVFPLCGGETG